MAAAATISTRRKARELRGCARRGPRCRPVPCGGGDRRRRLARPEPRPEPGARRARGCAAWCAAATRPPSSRTSRRPWRPSRATCATPGAADRLFDGVGAATVFHAAGCDPPRARHPRALRRERRRHPARARPGPPVRREPLRARVLELAVRREPDAAPTASPRTRRTTRISGTGSRSTRPSCWCSAATTAATWRPSSCARPGSTARTSPPARRASSPRCGAAASRSRAPVRTAGRSSTPATSSTGCCAPRSRPSRPAARTGSRTLNPSSCGLCSRRCATRSPRRDCGSRRISPISRRAPRRSPPRPTRCSRAAAATSRRSTCSGSCATRSPATSGGARAELGYEPAVGLLEGMRASVRWCLQHGARL